MRTTRRYNGFGGKVEPGESVEAAALRELKVVTVQSPVRFAVTHLHSGGGRDKREAGPVRNVFLPA